MFTALTVTRLIYTQLVSWGVLQDFSMRRLIGVPKVDWVGLRHVFWPISMVVVAGGASLFLWMSVARTQSFFDIEFIGGTSVQLDLKPGVQMSDVEVREAVTSTEPSSHSAVAWISNAATRLESAQVAGTPVPFQFSVTAAGLTGEQIAVLLAKPLEGVVVRDGVSATGETATFTTQGANEGTMRTALATAASNARAAADKLRSARIQTVGGNAEGGASKSFEVVTVETNRAVIQEAMLASLGDKLAVQRALKYQITPDEETTRQGYFVIESEDQYVSDVLKTDAAFDIRHFRGGVMVEAVLDETEEPITVAELEARLREVGLQPEFEQFRTRETAVFPLGPAAQLQGGQPGYKRFAVAALDESVLYEEEPALWETGVAQTVLAQVNAALGAEKSLSKVVQFAPQIAKQTTTRAVFATILALIGIGAYIWFRFSARDFGMAIIITTVHDVCVVLGAIAISHFLAGNLGSLLMIDDFRFDLTMLAAVLTIIGYSLNDTIVVFDRIREMRGRTGALSQNLINDAINQTMSRTVLTSLLVGFTVLTLYFFGGPGIHGFAYAMLIGSISGTYSTIFIAVPLVYEPKILGRVMLVLVVLIAIGLTILATDNWTVRLILGGLILIAAAAHVIRGQRREEMYGAPARA
jgi:SecD/SecF fusion protein